MQNLSCFPLSIKFIAIHSAYNSSHMLVCSLHLISNSTLSFNYFFITLIFTLIFSAQTWLGTWIFTYLKSKEIKVPKNTYRFYSYGSSIFEIGSKKTLEQWLEKLLWKRIANSREIKIISKERCTPSDLLYFECRAHYWPCCTTLFHSDLSILWDRKSGMVFLSLALTVCMVLYKQHNLFETWKQNCVWSAPEKKHWLSRTFAVYLSIEEREATVRYYSFPHIWCSPSSNTSQNWNSLSSTINVPYWEITFSKCVQNRSLASSPKENLC